MRIRTFLDEHRRIEAELDALAEALDSAGAAVERFRSAVDLAARHYAAEDRFLTELRGRWPGPAAKLLGQHAEVLELAAQAEESLAAGRQADALALIRRFRAMAQHNIIEEERDVFPLIADEP